MYAIHDASNKRLVGNHQWKYLEEAHYALVTALNVKAETHLEHDDGGYNVRRNDDDQIVGYVVEAVAAQGEAPSDTKAILARIADEPGRRQMAALKLALEEGEIVAEADHADALELGFSVSGRWAYSEKCYPHGVDTLGVPLEAPVPTVSVYYLGDKFDHIWDYADANQAISKTLEMYWEDADSVGFVVRDMVTGRILATLVTEEKFADCDGIVAVMYLEGQASLTRYGVSYETCPDDGHYVRTNIRPL